MLKQIATVISDANTNIRNIEAKTAEEHATVEIVADIADVKHLERIITGVRKFPASAMCSAYRSCRKAAVAFGTWLMARSRQLPVSIPHPPRRPNLSP